MTRLLPILTLFACMEQGSLQTDDDGTSASDTTETSDSESSTDEQETDDGPSATDTDGTGETDIETDTETDAVACTYPNGAVEPMALNEVLFPYSWPKAIDGAGTEFPIDLNKVPCADDPNIDWSPFDVLLFVSIPAW